MFRTIPLLVVLLLLTPLVGCGASSLLRPDESRPTADSRAGLESAKLDQIIAQGRIEPASGIVSVFAAPGDRVNYYADNVMEGAIVTKDEALGQLASHKRRQLELRAHIASIEETKAMRQAGLAAKTSDLAVAKSVIDQVDAAAEELIAKKKEIESLARQLDLAVEESRRMLNLRRTSDLISDRKINQAHHAADQARVALEAAKIQYDVAKATAQANREAAQSKQESIAATHDRALAAIPQESTHIKRQLLMEQLHESTIPAPASGTILKIFTRPGDTVGRKPLLQLADLDQMVCITEVYESYLKNVRPGQRAILRSAAFDPDVQVRGTIQSIGRLILGAELKELDPFAKTDVRVVEVKIAIDSGESTAEAAKLVNLQVEVAIDAKNSDPE